MCSGYPSTEPEGIPLCEGQHKFQTSTAGPVLQSPSALEISRPLLELSLIDWHFLLLFRRD